MKNAPPRSKSKENNVGDYAPRIKIAKVVVCGDQLRIKCRFFDTHRAKGAPISKWSKKDDCFILPSIDENIRYIADTYDDEEQSDGIKALIKMVKGRQKIASDFPAWFKFKMTPRPYQMDALNKSWSKDSFALFMQMRTGKTFVTINLMAARAQDGQITAMLVICPTSAKPVWEIEMEKHCPLPYSLHMITAGKKTTTRRFIKEEYDDIKVMVVGVEALSQGGAYDLALEFAAKYRTLVVCDESTSIKTPKKARTDKAHNLADIAHSRLILNGTPVTQGVQDLWSQYRFLDWLIIKQKSYYNYMHRHCIMGGFEGRKVVGYDNLKELLDRIGPYTYQISTHEAIGLPERVNETLVIEMSPAQKKALEDLGDPLMVTELDGDVLDVETVLERMIRYQQIVGGHFPYDKSEGGHGIKAFAGKNPKLEEMMAMIENFPTEEKVIIWARFSPEIDMIMERLTKDYGAGSAVWYRGGMTDGERKASLISFEQEPNCRFFVTNQMSGGRAIDLASASVHIYFSNTFSLDDRLQSEMRTNSSNQKSKSVLYVDIVANHKIDKNIAGALANKKEVADFVEAELKARR